MNASFMRRARRKPKIALDTNVLFSALALPRESPPCKVLELVRKGQIDAFISPCILEELERVLYLKMGWDIEKLASLRKQLKGCLFFIFPKRRLNTIKKCEEDNRVLELAVEAGVDALVTGDLKHIHPLGAFEGIEILTPREFLDKYFPSAR